MVITVSKKTTAEEINEALKKVPHGKNFTSNS